MSLEKNLEANTHALNRNILVMEKLLARLNEGLPTPTTKASVKTSTKPKTQKSNDSNETTTYNISDARAALIHIANADSQDAAKSALQTIAGVAILPKAEPSKYADLIHYAVNEYQYVVSA